MSRGPRGVLVVVATAISAFAPAAGVAHAGPKKAKTIKVEVESDPPGATVYLNLKEDGPVCDATPCTIDAPIGETPIIVELEGHETSLEVLVVTKKDKKLKVSYTLASSVGSIVVKGPKGATIMVDDAERGTAPARVEVTPGPHIVVLMMGSKQLASDAVEVENNGEVMIATPRKGGGGGGLDDNPLDPDDPGITIKEPVKETPPSAPRKGPILVASLQMDVGFRAFRYDNAEGDNLRPENEGGQVLIGPAIELYPGTLFGVNQLRGLALLFHFGFGASSNAVGSTASGETMLNASTYWRSLEVSIRQRWVIADKASVAVGAGYVQELYRFSGEVTDIAKLPDAQYGAIRIGARASLLLGSLEPYVLGETRIVQSGGPLEERFDTADASGLHAAGGVAIKAGSRLVLKLEAAITRYSWSFTARSGMDTADGATDSIKQLGISVGFQL